MKLIDLLVKITNKDKNINGLKFKCMGAEYYIKNYKIYYTDLNGFEFQVKSIGTNYLNEKIHILKEK